ncbi:hypothetical protein BV912_04605 [Neisseria dumasiana]|uniref:Uncharacterized protein n=1 Tax=Neisseria dumasiana TaxID=1931275 RepID=A0A1X3DJD5_9NEIS|nr:hypothetical protein BV912_04605 [Neisseria dumasiana]
MHSANKLKLRQKTAQRFHIMSCLAVTSRPSEYALSDGFSPNRLYTRIVWFFVPFRLIDCFNRRRFKPIAGYFMLAIERTSEEAV